MKRICIRGPGPLIVLVFLAGCSEQSAQRPVPQRTLADRERKEPDKMQADTGPRLSRKQISIPEVQVTADALTLSIDTTVNVLQ